VFGYLVDALWFPFSQKCYNHLTLQSVNVDYDRT